MKSMGLECPSHDQSNVAKGFRYQQVLACILNNIIMAGYRITKPGTKAGTHMIS